ncbi:MauE/DoxX family redox-associated membrane protein [Chitinophaga sp.]|uniref:MauE/DoxX family redox-associated membrane protein n=1 Tax=Chitinophaga sp. TaxID=1869181 RepID=UPI0031E20C73
MLTKRLIEFISALLVFLFIYTSISKLLDYTAFNRQLSQSPFISRYANIISWALPLGELLIAGLLLINKTRLSGLYCSFFLLNLFTFYLTAMLRYSPYIPCSCGGVLQHLSWQAHIIFNAAFIILTTMGVLMHVKKSR